MTSASLRPQKENLDIFKFVQTDSFSYKAVVFSGGKAVGMIDQPTFDLAHFESFPIQENSVDLGFPKWLYGLLLISWYFRWWLLPAQLIILLLWLLQREKKDQHSNL